MITVMGIDQALTSTGICILDRYAHPETGELCTDITHSEVIHTKPEGERSLESDLVRIQFIATRIAELIREYRPVEILLESPSFSSEGNATRSLAVLYGYLLGLFEDFPMGSVAPKALKKFATDKGNACKTMMLTAVRNPVHFKHLAAYKKTKGRADVVDAYWLAQYALNKEE